MPFSIDHLGPKRQLCRAWPRLLLLSKNDKADLAAVPRSSRRGQRRRPHLHCP